ncbi:unnamed protein product [Allacma fusca]|uniref:CDP-diacylglycerol--glycerol-3-phosphate 3-phosphatidyltransferase, mitochondrial n=1 Tax=Allacma fusca TaxID=39272 RepID=A0A8J2K2C2_9HEXA|nr:unnamed protein product [Allacma fusca]
MAYVSSWKWLAQLGPGFSMSGSTVRVLSNPDSFYSVLMEKSKSASRRVSLASLYIGNGKLERELIGALQENMERNGNLEVKVLLDYSRGTRGFENSSRSLLLPLLKCSNSCNVFLYHTPTLRGLAKKILPQRWNEIIGIQHMKIYIFDDSLVITGANLSHDYFTNRQDRYIVVEDCESLANFYDGLINQVSSFSFKLQSDNNLNLSSGWNIHPANGDHDQFVKEAGGAIRSYYDSYCQENNIRLKSFLDKSNDLISRGSQSSNDTWIFPLIQMAPLNIGIDNTATCRIFEQAPEESSIKLATGYFNLTSEYVDKIVNKSRAGFDILMAHPEANGFLGARGVAGGIPAAYTQLAKMFLAKVKNFNQEKRIGLWEYRKPGWTFHAKGLWFYPTRSSLPLVTLIGSPNFGHRSVFRDLETQLYIVTENVHLQKQLHDEQLQLIKHCKPFDDHVLSQPNRLVPLWVKLFQFSVLPRFQYTSRYPGQWDKNNGCTHKIHIFLYFTITLTPDPYKHYSIPIYKDPKCQIKQDRASQEMALLDLIVNMYRKMNRQFNSDELCEPRKAASNDVFLLERPVPKGSLIKHKDHIGEVIQVDTRATLINDEFVFANVAIEDLKELPEISGVLNKGMAVLLDNHVGRIEGITQQVSFRLPEGLSGYFLVDQDECSAQISLDDKIQLTEEQLKTTTWDTEAGVIPAEQDVSSPATVFRIEAIAARINWEAQVPTDDNATPKPSSVIEGKSVTRLKVLRNTPSRIREYFYCQMGSKLVLSVRSSHHIEKISTWSVNMLGKMLLDDKQKDTAFTQTSQAGLARGIGHKLVVKPLYLQSQLTVRWIDSAGESSTIDSSEVEEVIAGPEATFVARSNTDYKDASYGIVFNYPAVRVLRLQYEELCAKDLIVLNDMQRLLSPREVIMRKDKCDDFFAGQSTSITQEGRIEVVDFDGNKYMRWPTLLTPCLSNVRTSVATFDSPRPSDEGSSTGVDWTEIYYDAIADLDDSENYLAMLTQEEIKC